MPLVYPPVLVEIEMLRDDLLKYDIVVPMEEIKTWSTKDRAYAETWVVGRKVDMPQVLRPFVPVDAVFKGEL